MPPAKSGVADYSASLLPELQKLGYVRLSPAEYGIGVYQLGNNLLHREIYTRALERPGIAVLHDAVLQHFFLGSLTEEQYVQEFVYNYGEWSRAEAKLMWKERAASGQDARYFSRAMLRRVAEASKVVIVHNPAAGALVHEHAPGALVKEIALFRIPEPPADPVETVLQRGTVRYWFGVFGFLRESKRLIAILKTFSRLRRVRDDVGLLIAGQMHSSDLQRAVEPYLGQPGVRRMGYMNPAQFAAASDAVDCCINLRYPSAGETSAIAVRMMGLGKPVIVTEGEENASLPDHTFLSVRPGAAEEAHLFELMAFLSECPERGREIGRRAADHILRYHSLSGAARQYWTILCDYCT